MYIYIMRGWRGKFFFMKLNLAVFGVFIPKLKCEKPNANFVSNHLQNLKDYLQIFTKV